MALGFTKGILEVGAELGGAKVRELCVRYAETHPGFPVPKMVAEGKLPAFRRYDLAAGDLWAQASQSSACTFTYGMRSGIEARPDKWPSTVTVRWTITWSSTDGGGGTFPTVDRTVAIPRAVREVQTIVTSGE